jgi:hypothetical protein
MDIIARCTNIINYSFDSSVNLTGYSAKLYLEKSGANGFELVKDSSLTFDVSTMKGNIITTLSITDSSLVTGQASAQYIFDNSIYKFSEGIFTVEVKPSLI